MENQTMHIKLLAKSRGEKKIWEEKWRKKNSPTSSIFIYQKTFDLSTASVRIAQ